MMKEAQWFEYEWPLEGRTARFAVDMSLAEAAEPVTGHSAFPALLFLACASKRREAKELSAIESAAAEALCRRVEKKLSPLYAGFIEVDAMRQFYFYFPDLSRREELEALARRELLLSCRAGSAEEPDWVTYRSLLYPDAAKLQTERNRDHIELMHKHGDCIVSVRRVSFSLFFATEAIMLQFAEEARLAGFAVAGPVYDPENELAYGTKIVRLTSLKKRNIDKLTTRAIRIAEQYGGELRYWDSPVIKRGGPLMENK